MSPPVGALVAEVAGRLGLEPGAPYHFLGASPRVPLDAVMADRARRPRARTAHEAQSATCVRYL